MFLKELANKIVRCYIICEKARSKVQNFLRKNTFQRKKHAFQYLGGYVFCKLYEKFKMAGKKYE